MATSFIGWWMLSAAQLQHPAPGWPQIHPPLVTGRFIWILVPPLTCGVTSLSSPHMSHTPVVPPGLAASRPSHMAPEPFRCASRPVPLVTSKPLKNVLYVPDLAKQPGGPVRLFSASSAADQSGAEVTTGANTRITMSNGMVIPGRRAGKHFFIDAIPGFLPNSGDEHTTFLALSSSAPAQQRAVWHARLCHMNHVLVDKVLRAHNVEI